jgi:hypothetical protein
MRFANGHALSHDYSDVVIRVASLPLCRWSRRLRLPQGSII